MKENRIKYLIGMVITAFVIYNVALFGIAGFADHTGTFWVSYIFSLITFAAIFMAVALLENKTMRLRDWLFRLPLIKHSVIYAVCELVISLIFMLFSRKIPMGAALAVQVIILGIYIVFALSCMVAKDMIIEVNQKTAEKTVFMKVLKADAELAVQLAVVPEQKKMFAKLAEDIRFSDPMSAPELAVIEQELAECLKNVVNDLKAKNNQYIMDYCQKAEKLLRERNEKCKIYK